MYKYQLLSTVKVCVRKIEFKAYANALTDTKQTLIACRLIPPSGDRGWGPCLQAMKRRSSSRLYYKNFLVNYNSPRE